MDIALLIFMYLPIFVVAIIIGISLMEYYQDKPKGTWLKKIENKDRHECNKPQSYLAAPGSVWKCECGKMYQIHDYGYWIDFIQKGKK